MNQLPLQFNARNTEKEEEKPYRLYEYKIARSVVSDVTASASIHHASDVKHILKDYFAPLDREHFLVLHLNSKHKVVARETVSVGSLDRSLAHPREVFKSAVINSSASIIMAHNHPSGDPSPSREDIELTKRLCQAGEILGIKLLDHIIVAGEEFSSLSEMGYITKGD